MIYSVFARWLRHPRTDTTKAVFARGAGYTLVIKVAGLALAFGLQLLLARLLGVGVYGQYIYVFTWITVLAVLGKLGFDTASLRFISEYSAQEKWGLVRSFVRCGSQITIFTSLVISVIAASMIGFFFDDIGADVGQAFLVGFVLLPIVVLLQVYSAHLQALKHVVLAQIPSAILRPIMLTLGILMAIGLYGGQLSASDVMVVEIVVFVAIAVFVWWLYHAKVPHGVVCSDYRLGQWLRSSVTFLLLSGLYTLQVRTDVLMIGVLAGTSEAGVYSVATRVAESLLLGLAAVNMIAAPMIAQLFSQGRMTELQEVVHFAAKASFAFSVPVAIVLILFGESVLGIFGLSFTAGYWPMVVLIVGQLVNALAGSVVFIMTMTGHEKFAAAMLGFSTLLNIVLNIILIPLYGITGAAIATAVTTVIWNMALFVAVWARIGINASIFAFRCEQR